VVSRAVFAVLRHGSDARRLEENACLAGPPATAGATASRQRQKQFAPVKPPGPPQRALSEVESMQSVGGFGFLSIAIGARGYIRQAEILSLSLRRNMPGIPLAILPDDHRLARYADILVPVDHPMPITAAQKILLDRYSPFERTLFIDCDCVATRSFQAELAAIGNFPFSP